VQLYRLHYLSSSDLAPLIKPLLTPGVGQVGVTLDRNTEAACAAIADADGTLPPDALLVVDYPEVIEMVGRAIGELDVPAQHVELEATLLDVEVQGSLSDDVWRILNPSCREPEFPSQAVAGVQNPSCQTSCQVCGESGERILSCLRSATEVRVLSQARLQVLDKQSAELSIGGIDVPQTADARNVASGSPPDETRLRVRPFVSADGMIRLDVAPEGRPGSARPAYASLRTSVAVSDGGTLIIADLNNCENSGTPSSTGAPAFRGRGKPVPAVRHEFVLLISPRTVHTGSEGDRNLAPLTAAGEERLIQ
jgi:type II secretory pathway component GspD/PulD (secretin)